MSLLSRFLLPALGACALLGSCVIVDADSRTQYRGRQVSDRTLARLQPGSSQELVLALLDEPTTRTNLGDGASIWRWSYTKTVTQSNCLLFVFNGDSTTESQGSVFVEFGSDQLVLRSWRD